ncbi:MAG: RNase H family protein [Chloroflexota bacterium]
MQKHIDIHISSCCSSNPGVGGYGLKLIYAQHQKTIAGGYRYTTNGRIALHGVIVALQAITESCQIAVHTPVDYLVKAFNQDWVSKWVENDWYKADGEPVKNQDLWRHLLKLIDKHEQVTFTLLDKNSQAGQDMAQLAQNAIAEFDLPADLVYEQQARVAL